MLAGSRKRLWATSGFQDLNYISQIKGWKEQGIHPLCFNTCGQRKLDWCLVQNGMQGAVEEAKYSNY